MRIRSLPTRVGLSVVLGASLGVTTSAAMPAAAFAGAKPSCVSVKVKESNPGGFYSKQIATVSNNCSTTKHLKVIWHAGRDSSCRTVKPGRSTTSQAQLTISGYDHTVTC